jgi:AhpC/TSA family
MTTPPTFAEQRDEFNARLAEQAPAEVLEGFGRIIADQAAVDCAARAPKFGERAPDFTLRDQFGRQVSLAGELEHGPVVLIFYRGEWCPYCNIMLRTYGLRASDSQNAEPGWWRYRRRHPRTRLRWPKSTASSSRSCRTRAAR